METAIHIIMSPLKEKELNDEIMNMVWRQFVLSPQLGA